MANNNGNRPSDDVLQLDPLLRALRTSLGRVDQIELAAGRLVDTGSSQITATDQTRASVEKIAARIEETATAGEELARSQTGVAANAREVLVGLESTASALQEVAASVDSVRKDTVALAAGCDRTAAALEETGRGLKGATIN